jgi:hypothetical protein
MRIARILVTLAVTLYGCGQPDSVVFGAFTGAIIPEVRSAIHGNAQVEFSQGTKVPMSVILLSDTAGLCDKLGQHPDFFRTSYGVATTVVLFIPQDSVGNVLLGSFAPGVNNANAEIVVDLPLPDGGTTNSAFGFPAFAGQGIISVSQLNMGNGGEAKGSFDVLILGSDQLAHEFFGHFKSKFCAATANVLFP